jgi:hypothetical protein
MHVRFAFLAQKILRYATHDMFVREQSVGVMVSSVEP